MGIIGKLFSNKELDEFAKGLAQSLAKRYPPSLEAAQAKKISINRITRVLEDVVEKAVDYNRKNPLGIYRKARLGNTFKWEMKELGYSDKFIEVATEALIVNISRKPAAKAGADGKA
ncbi:MAG: hypothetical protein EXR31_11260 [Betaproteobacteria bacterium]|nr:hypothetical protein [Betaproteobacteria bacterium]